MFIQDNTHANDSSLNLEKEGSQVQTPSKNETEPRSSGFFTAQELLNLKLDAIPYLVSPIIPKIGVTAIVAKPDTGKSILMQQICLQIASGDTTFLGLDLNATHKKAMYISTEDSVETLASRLSIQKQNTSGFDPQNLGFYFSEGNSAEILKMLEERLHKEPLDLVVIDAFGDIYEGNDMNNNAGMRHTLKPYKQLAEKYKTAVIFVHHINKAGYKQSPSQEHIQGGSGFTQKIRSVLQLVEGKDNKRGLVVLKGNNCPKEFKQKAIELLIDEDKLWITKTGNMVDPKKISLPLDSALKDEDSIEQLAESIFENEQGSKFTDLVAAIMKKEDASESTAKRRITKMSQEGLIFQKNGLYYKKTDTDVIVGVQNAA